MAKQLVCGDAGPRLNGPSTCVYVFTCLCIQRSFLFLDAIAEVSKVELYINDEDNITVVTGVGLLRKVK